jgi:hypothetical protein
VEQRINPNYRAAIESGLDKSNPIPSAVMNVIDYPSRWMHTNRADIPVGANRLTYAKPRTTGYKPTTTGERVVEGIAEFVPAGAQALMTGGIAGGLAKAPGLAKTALQIVGSTIPGAVRGAERGYTKGGAGEAALEASKSVGTDVGAAIVLGGAGKFILAPMVNAVKSEVLSALKGLSVAAAPGKMVKEAIDKASVVLRNVPGGKKFSEKVTKKFWEAGNKIPPALIEAALKRTSEGRLLVKTVGLKDAQYAVQSAIGRESIPAKIGAKEIEKSFENPALMKVAGQTKIEDDGLLNMVSDVEKSLTLEPGKLVGKHSLLNNLKKDAWSVLSDISDNGWTYKDISDLRQSYRAMAVEESDELKKKFYEGMAEAITKRLSAYSGRIAPVVNVFEENLKPVFQTQYQYKQALKEAAEKKAKFLGTVGGIAKTAAWASIPAAIAGVGIVSDPGKRVIGRATNTIGSLVKKR